MGSIARAFGLPLVPRWGGSDDEAEDGMPTGRIPGAAGYSTNLPEEGISNVTGARSVLDEALDGWKETSEKMTSSDRDQICARSFVTAALATVVVFDSFGKLLQSFQADMRKNVRMIQQHISHDSVTLQDLIDGECQRAGSYAQAIVEGSLRRPSCALPQVHPAGLRSLPAAAPQLGDPQRDPSGGARGAHAPGVLGEAAGGADRGAADPAAAEGLQPRAAEDPRISAALWLRNVKSGWGWDVGCGLGRSLRS
eukprot:Skav201442  [mRNA]  locus=scaffold6:110157:114748:+ [translate_table: standard]